MLEDDGAGVAIEAVESVVVSDALHGAADDLLKIDVGFGGDFSGDDDQAGGGKRFAGDAGLTGIFGEAGASRMDVGKSGRRSYSGHGCDGYDSEVN